MCIRDSRRSDTAARTITVKNAAADQEPPTDNNRKNNPDAAIRYTPTRRAVRWPATTNFGTCARARSEMPKSSILGPSDVAHTPTSHSGLQSKIGQFARNRQHSSIPPHVNSPRKNPPSGLPGGWVVTPYYEFLIAHSFGFVGIGFLGSRSSRLAACQRNDARMTAFCLRSSGSRWS